MEERTQISLLLSQDVKPSEIARQLGRCRARWSLVAGSVRCAACGAESRCGEQRCGWRGGLVLHILAPSTLEALGHAPRT
ncbi:hypothetical protein G3A44_19195 [Ideonella sp. TBM-1]|uniref:Uncharacterized protein n=1 Tax=Ideonella livida TaxID=2707176 RepID=A0A7C9TMM3_9BURK|nr:hypothetical protein [Ideonella livida]